MAWGVYKPKKPKYAVGGFSVASKARKPKVSGWAQVSGSKGPKKVSGGVGSPSVVSKLLAGGAAAGGVAPDPSGGFDPFPGYNDPFSGMLANLAAQKARAEGMLRGDLTGREAAIKKLYADQAPLVDANYNQAIKESAAVNDAVTNQLHSQGNTTEANLLQKLSQIGTPQGATDAAAQQVKDYYGGLSNANYAMDAGDVQRLIGALSEAQNYLAKQPGVIAQQLESEYASAIADLQSQFMIQSGDLQGQQISGQNDYNMQKFGYEQQQKTTAADTKAALAKDAENRYWDNYWKQRDYQQKRYELGVATSNKKMQLQAQAEMKKLDRAKDMDIANLRSQTSLAINAQTTATSAANNAATNKAKIDAANAKKNNPSASTQRQAYQAAYRAVVNPNGRVKYLAHYGDKRVISEINSAMEIAGINPNSPMGQKIRAQVLRNINGKMIETGGDKTKAGAKYKSP